VKFFSTRARRSGLRQDVMENRILASLPEDLRDEIGLRLEKVELQTGATLFRPFEPVRHVYFPTTATLSLVALTQTGATLEVCIIGCEGAAGVTAIMGGASPYGGLVQVSGEALRMPAALLRELFRRHEPVRNALLRYIDARLMQVSQSGVCNRFHTVKERLARWLLEIHDRTPYATLPLTHDALSSMLGARRASVTVAAAALRKARLIRYGRGHIHITNRRGLERLACECYPLIRNKFDAVCN
jgi:CRP-like cAMP-binding protein